MIDIIIGLGNPGPKYAHSRHNLGFDLLDLICEKWQITRRIRRNNYLFVVKEVSGKEKTIIWPVTFMNNSGQAVLKALEDFGIIPGRALIVTDDFNLPLGRIRLRSSGSDGGHNGLQSIIYHLETEDIPRLRLGIGPIGENIDQLDFVLGKFTAEEAEKRKKMLEIGADCVLYLLTHNLEEAMSIYNQTPAPDQDD
nr:aminoacyl-tRNA hydrolase [candidate division Zixibacteria bacterium]